MQGEAFSRQDVDTAADVCVIGSTVANKLFGGDDAVGKVVRVKNLPVRVIGLLATKGQSTFGQDQDDVIMMPYTTVMKKLVGIDWLQLITASTDSKADVNLQPTRSPLCFGSAITCERMRMTIFPSAVRTK